MNNKLLIVLKGLKEEALKKDALHVYARFFSWQIKRFIKKDSMTVRWVNDLKLEVVRHRNAATANYYLGLAEFEEMSFVMHYLRESDLMLDIGANIGDYAILGSGVAKARAIAVEPIESTCALMERNIELNNLHEKIIPICAAISSHSEQLLFSTDNDSVNRQITEEESKKCASTYVDTKSIKELADNYGIPDLIKVDVEGYEYDVLLSAEEVLDNKQLNVIVAENNDNEVLELLKNKGFSCYRYDPYNRALIEQHSDYTENIVFIRDIDLAKERVKTAQAFKINRYSI